MSKIGKSKNKGALHSRVAATAFTLVTSQALLGVLYILAARALSPAEFGLLGTCVAIALITTIMFDGGLNQWLTREGASGRFLAQTSLAFVSAKRSVSPVFFIGVAACTGVVLRSIALGLLFAAVAVCQWEAQSTNSILRSEAHFRRANTCQLVGRAAGVVTCLVLVLNAAADIFLLPSSLVVSYGVEAIAGHLYYRKVKFVRVPLRTLLAKNRKAFGYGVSALSASAQQLDTPLVVLGAGPAAAGIYSAASRILGPLSFLSSALSLVGGPWLAKEDTKRDLQARERQVVLLSTLMAALPFIAVVFGPTLLPAILGSPYLLSGRVVAVLALGSALSTFSQGTAIIAQNRMQEGRVGLIFSASIIVGLAATFLLAVVGGVVLAAGGFVLSQAMAAMLLYVLVRRTRFKRSLSANFDTSISDR